MSNQNDDKGAALDRYDGEQQPAAGATAPIRSDPAPARGRPAEPVNGAVAGSGAGAGGSGSGEPEDYDLDPQAGGGKVEQRHAKPAPTSGGDGKVGGSH